MDCCYYFVLSRSYCRYWKRDLQFGDCDGCKFQGTSNAGRIEEIKAHWMYEQAKKKRKDYVHPVLLEEKKEG
jgi:hypothetical protein